jgi:hypothetical protein
VDLNAESTIELLVADLSLARAFFEGVPAARLLARAQLARATEASDLAAWDSMLERLVGKDAAALERLRRALARHTRAALDEGPLAADAATLAALVCAVFAAKTGSDASIAEAFSSVSAVGDAVPDTIARACAAYDGRLARASGVDVRVPLFEACVRLATGATAGPWTYARLLETTQKLAASEIGINWTSAELRLFPVDFQVSPERARMTRIDRTSLDALVARDPRELASAIARVEAKTSSPSIDPRATRTYLDSFIADLGQLLKRTGALVMAVTIPDPEVDEALPSVPPSERPSAIPLDWSQPDVARQIADSFERGQTSLARLRSMILRGGEPALDSIGAEMLRVAIHPQASAAFADALARSARPRDVIRLVTYFAVTPDPVAAARALSACAAPELPSVLRAWLEAMLPVDGAAAPFGDDPNTSSAARLTACVASLEPYPHLYRAVRPLLSRVSERPPA